ITLITFLLVVVRRPGGSSPFPYTTLFRSLMLWNGVYVAPSVEVVYQIALFPPRTKTNSLAPITRAVGAEVMMPPTLVQPSQVVRSEEHTSELQSPYDLVCRLPLQDTTAIR